ncbi:hypothetical protein M0812_24522 [Anaeramoeba flamelloides]|uniref:Uncharacterized protein n=1 Tax=Anaeramoeba flamelloides TaxID=1746091 RepID=A0AAV7YH48_9EUKA|nr:hypothetical protein M0812_24522 [Anaeramoeba flamelloides]
MVSEKKKILFHQLYQINLNEFDINLLLKFLLSLLITFLKKNILTDKTQLQFLLIIKFFIKSLEFDELNIQLKKEILIILKNEIQKLKKITNYNFINLPISNNSNFPNKKNDNVVGDKDGARDGKFLNHEKNKKEIINENFEKFPFLKFKNSESSPLTKKYNFICKKLKNKKLKNLLTTNDMKAKIEKQTKILGNQKIELKRQKKIIKRKRAELIENRHNLKLLKEKYLIKKREFKEKKIQILLEKKNNNLKVGETIDELKSQLLIENQVEENLEDEKDLIVTKKLKLKKIQKKLYLKKKKILKEKKFIREEKKKLKKKMDLILKKIQEIDK